MTRAISAGQREIIRQAAEFDMLPPERVPHPIAEPENAVAAVEAVAGEEADRAQQAKG